MNYILKRTRPFPAYVAEVARNGGGSYTNKLQNAKVYPTRDAAERDRCVENEVVTTVEQEMAS